jgi:hypothetical protein
MNKFTRLTLLGSTIVIGLIVLGSSMLYFGIKQAIENRPIVQIQDSIDRADTVRIERVVERVVRDTIRIEVPCSRRHCDNALIISKSQSLTRIDSIQKDSHITNGN